MKKIISVVVILVFVLFVGFYRVKKSSDENIRVYYTNDLHSHFTKNMENYLKNIDRKNAILIDTGDTVDNKTIDDSNWLSKRYLLGNAVSDLAKEKKVTDGEVMEKFDRQKNPIPPVINKIFEYGYDVEVVGNHELVYGYEDLKDIKKAFEGQRTKLLSNNIYYKEGFEGHTNEERVFSPYMIKSFDTEKGRIKVAIISGTTNFVNEVKTNEKDDRKDYKTFLQSMDIYKDKMYMTDLVDETKKTVDMVRKKEKPDIVILAVHSGLKSKNPKHTGNRAQELAKIAGVDMIIGGHNHSVEERVELKNRGKTVIYTEAGSNGHCIGEANISLKKEKDGWKIKNIDTKINRFGINKNDPEEDYEIEDEESMDKYYEINNLKKIDKNEFERIKKKNPNVFISFVVPVKDGFDYRKYNGVRLTNEYESDGMKIIYLESTDFDSFNEIQKKYSFILDYR